MRLNIRALLPRLVGATGGLLILLGLVLTMLTVRKGVPNWLGRYWVPTVFVLAGLAFLAPILGVHCKRTLTMLKRHPLPIAALLLTLGSFCWLLWQGPWVLDRAHLTDKTTPGVASVVTGFRTMVVAIGAGTLASAGLVYTHRTLEHTRTKDREQAELTRKTLELTGRTLEHTQSRDREQAELTREGQVTDRFTKAIGQLASDKPVEQLGGVYALERIMRDSAKDHPTVVEVLAAFVRDRSPAQSPPDPAAAAEARPTEPVQAALTVLSRRPPDRHEPFRLDLHRTNLGNADLGEANLAEANLWETDLHGANLAGAILMGANLFRANFTGAFLRDAYLEGAILEQAELARADLGDAVGLTAEQMVGAYLYRSTKLPENLAADPHIRARIAEVEVEEVHRAAGGKEHDSDTQS